jgi:hypothetical protein
VSLLCEWSWAIRLSAAEMQMLFWRNFEDRHCPSSELFATPYLELPELSLISYVKLMENILPLKPGLKG